MISHSQSSKQVQCIIKNDLLNLQGLTFLLLTVHKCTVEADKQDIPLLLLKIWDLEYKQPHTVTSTVVWLQATRSQKLFINFLYGHSSCIRTLDFEWCCSFCNAALRRAGVTARQVERGYDTMFFTKEMWHLAHLRCAKSNVITFPDYSLAGWTSLYMG